MKVNFMIIGAQKCGTTTLFSILNSHPKLEGSHPKEPHYFSHLNTKPPDIEYYHSLFPKKDGVLYFEGSTSYTFYPYYHLKTWDLIYEYNPKMKFIYNVRNPIDRIISSYMHAYLRGETDLSMERALIDNHYMLDITRYYTQISPYINKFGSENVLILDFDDLKDNTHEVLSKVSAFLGVDTALFDEKMLEKHENKSLDKRVLTNKFRSRTVPVKIIHKLVPFLRKRFKEKNSRSFSEKPVLTKEQKDMIFNMLELEIREMEKLMDKDLSKWIKQSLSAVSTASIESK